jgi:prevent-host-death family protein
VVKHIRGEQMRYSEAIKPISYLKSHASEVIRDVTANHKTMIITHNGEAKVVVQDIQVYEKMQESLALLKILSYSSQNLKEGKFKPIDKCFSDIDEKIAGYKKNEPQR